MARQPHPDESSETESEDPPGSRKPLRKPLRWWATSKKDLRAFPADVRTDLGHNLDLVQQGRMPEHFDYLSSIGAGVVEIKASHDKETYRALYVAKFEEAVYVLHAFHKKSTKGKQIPKKDRELAVRRYAELVAFRQAEGLA